MQERSTLDQDRIAAEAAEWFARLDDGPPTARERQQFSEWLLRSSQHVEAYLTIARIGAEIGLFQDLPSKEELVTSARLDARREPWQNVIALRPHEISSDIAVTGPRRVRWRSRFTVPVAASFVITVLSLIALSLSFLNERTRLYTGIGEQRSVVLEEGSTVHLNTNSAAAVSLSRDERLVALNRGEARFTVTKDPERPFIVLTPHAAVLAVGTVFNVHIGAQGTVVSVIEGRVQVSQRERLGDEHEVRVSPNEIGPGQQIRVTGAGAIQSNPNHSFARAVQWPQHQISFHEETLAELVAELNRYRRQPIKIADPELALHEVDGSFDAFDHDSLLHYLERYHGVKVERRADGTVVLRQKP